MDGNHENTNGPYHLKVFDWRLRFGKRSVGRPTRRMDDIVKAAGSRCIQAILTLSYSPNLA